MQRGIHDIAIHLSDISGRTCEVTASTLGVWKVWLGEELLSLDTNMDKAIARARAVIAKRKVKVEVPFKNHEGTLGVATGFHAKNGNLMISVNGKSSQHMSRSWNGSPDFYNPDTPSEVFKELKSQQAIIKAAQHRVADLHRRWEISLEKLTNEAIDRKIVASQEDVPS